MCWAWAARVWRMHSGYRVNVYHMNEGHAALLTLALLERQMGGGPSGCATEADIDQVRRKCVFTTHTPVPAGHDRFSTEQAIRILGGDRTARLEKLGCFREGLLNMTLLALRFSRYANGVAMQHGKVSREMFPRVSDRHHHQRRARAHVGVGADSADARRADSRLAPRQSLPAQCHRSARAEDSDGTRPRQGSATDRGWLHAPAWC